MAEGIYKIDQFRGIDQSDSESAIADGYAPDAQNVRCEGNRLSTTRGFRKFCEAAVPGGIHSLAAFRSRAHPALLAVNEGAVYSLGADGAWTRRYEQAGMERASYLNYARDGEDVVLLATGKAPLLWDGSDSMVPMEGAPQGIRHLALHYERVWAGGAQDEPDTVHWSRAYDPTDWSNDTMMPEAGGGFVMVPTWNGGRVRGVKTFFNDVVVFKDEDIFRLYGTYPGNYEVVRVHGVVGPVAERTIVAWGDRVFFFAEEGLCAYNGVAAQPMDKGRARRFIENIDFEVAQKTACAAVFNERLYVALPERGHTANSAVLEVDLRRDVWMIRRGFRADDFLVWEGRLLFCNDTGYVYALEEGEDYDGTPIEAYWETKVLDFGKMEEKKRGGSLYMVGVGRMRVVQETERGEHSRVVDFGPEMRLRRAQMRGIGRRTRLRMENVEGRTFCIEGGVRWAVETEED